jgi:hypothetical protein
MDLKCDTKKLLAILRNPYGQGYNKAKEARLAAADLIEELIKDYQNLLEWAEENGLDVVARNR